MPFLLGAVGLGLLGVVVYQAFKPSSIVIRKAGRKIYNVTFNKIYQGGSSTRYAAHALLLDSCSLESKRRNNLKMYSDVILPINTGQRFHAGIFITYAPHLYTESELKLLEQSIKFINDYEKLPSHLTVKYNKGMDDAIDAVNTIIEAKLTDIENELTAEMDKFVKQNTVIVNDVPARNDLERTLIHSIIPLVDELDEDTRKLYLPIVDRIKNEVNMLEHKKDDQSVLISRDVLDFHLKTIGEEIPVEK